MTMIMEDKTNQQLQNTSNTEKAQNFTKNRNAHVTNSQT